MMGIRAATAISALALLAAACETDADIEPQAPPTGSPRTQLEIGEVQSFIPATHEDGGKVVMPVTFPDGTTAEILYPLGLDLARLRPQPYSSGRLSDCCAFDFFVLYGAVPKSELAGTAPRRIYRGVEGDPVEYWRMGAAGHDPQIDRWLIFRFSKWYVFISDSSDSMTEQQRATFTRSLRGQATGDGFLRLSAEPPLQLAKAGEHAGPELLFSTRRKIARFFVGECQPHPKRDGRITGLGGKTGPKADWAGGRCVEKQSMGIHVQSGDKGFARRVMERIDVRDVQLAS